LEIKCHNNKYSPVALVLLDLNKPENYKAVVLSENEDNVYLGLRCTEDKIIVKYLDHADSYNYQLEPIINGTVAMPEIFKKYYEEGGYFHYDISNDLQQVVFVQFGKNKAHLYDLVNMQDKVLYGSKCGLPLFTKHDQTIIEGYGPEVIHKKILLNKQGEVLCGEKNLILLPGIGQCRRINCPILLIYLKVLCI